MYTFICISCKWHCPLKIKQNSLLAHSATCLGRSGLVFLSNEKEFIVFILHMCFWNAELWISSGGCYYICKQSWFGVLLTLGQSIQPCPKQRLSKRNPSCSPVRRSDCLHVPWPLSAPCPELMCNGWCWCVSLCEWTLCTRCGSM